MATVKELRAQAKALGIKGYSRMKKAELQQALSAVSKVSEVPEAETVKKHHEAETQMSTEASKMLLELRNETTIEARGRASRENAAAILACKTEAEVKALLETVSKLSMLISVQRAVFQLSGSAPKGWIARDYAGSLAKLVMRVKAGECPTD